MEQNDINLIIKKINNKENMTYMEFIRLIEAGFELQFFYKKHKYGITQFDGYEFYEWDKEEGYQTYPTIEEFKENININGVKIKEIWQDVKKVDFAD